MSLQAFIQLFRTMKSVCNSYSSSIMCIMSPLKLGKLEVIVNGDPVIGLLHHVLRLFTLTSVLYKYLSNIL